MQTTTAGSRDPQHSDSSLALSNSNSNNNNDDAESKRRKATQACDYCRQKRTKCGMAQFLLYLACQLKLTDSRKLARGGQLPWCAICLFCSGL